MIWQESTYSFRSPQGNSCNAGDVLQAKFANRLSCLLLIATVDSYGRAGRYGSFTVLSCFNVRIRRAGSLILLILGSRNTFGRGGWRVVFELLYSWVRHLGRGGKPA